MAKFRPNLKLSPVKILKFLQNVLNLIKGVENLSSFHKNSSQKVMKTNEQYSIGFRQMNQANWSFIDTRVIKTEEN